MITPDRSRAAWRKSSHSGSNSECVEVALLERRAAVRDSKNPAGPVLTFPAQPWEQFLTAVRAGVLGRS